MKIMNIKVTPEEYQKFNSFVNSCYSSKDWNSLSYSERLAELSNFLEDLNEGICPFCDSGDTTNVIQECDCRNKNEGE